MNQQNYFSQASRAYLDVQRLLVQSSREMNMDYSDRKEILKEFDLLMQLVLLYVIKADGQVTNIEVSFIKKLFIEQDLVEVLNQYYNTEKLSWSKIVHILESHQDRSFLLSVHRILRPKINHFFLRISSIDANTKKDYFEELKNYIEIIVLCFAKVNSIYTEDEEKLVHYLLEEKLFKKYQDVKEVFKLK